MRVAVLWSGGKESSLACHEVMAQGHDIAVLVTFILNDWPFLCHPLSIMSLQSKALGIPHTTLKVQEPYRETYRSSISELVKRGGIQSLVTGDIWIDDHKRWMESVCEGLGVEVIMPLWNARPSQILDSVLSRRFKPVFTCVKEPWFNAEWLGRELDATCVRDLNDLHDRFQVDLCGENGEYHTMVLDGPMFKHSIKIDEFTKEKKSSILFLKVDRFSLQPKLPSKEEKVP